MLAAVWRVMHSSVQLLLRQCSLHTLHFSWVVQPTIAERSLLGTLLICAQAVAASLSLHGSVDINTQSLLTPNLNALRLFSQTDSARRYRPACRIWIGVLTATLSS